MSRAPYHVLVIEDNAELAYGLENNLEIEGHRVSVATEGRRGLELARGERPDLIVLDLMLPDLDGFRVLRELRADDRETPVLILTARGEEEDKVRGLKLGADDYVTKPFGLLELLARVEAMLRRRRRGEESDPRPLERFGDVEVDRAARVVTRAGVLVPLAPKELDLLLALLDAGGAARSRANLMEEVWGYQADVLSRTVDTHVAELRRKLESDPASPKHLLTVRKVGYRLQR
ncbi:MAG: response regulator transcription factor [Gemmatimonadales bacterium]